MKITVLAQFTAKEGKIEQLKQQLLHLIDITRAEKGCINYDLHQQIDNSHEFFLYENWESEQELEEHLQAEHLSKFLALSPELLARPLLITRSYQLSEVV